MRRILNAFAASTTDARSVPMGCGVAVSFALSAKNAFNIVSGTFVMMKIGASGITAFFESAEKLSISIAVDYRTTTVFK